MIVGEVIEVGDRRVDAVIEENISSAIFLEELVVARAVRGVVAEEAAAVIGGAVVAIAFAERDLKGVLSDYAPGAIFFSQKGLLKGIDAIRPLFEALIAEFRKPGATFKMKEQLVEGDYAYILWTAETADNVYELGTDTFVVRGGKIVAQSFTGQITPKA